MPLPDLILVGGMKCGTTALHGYLAGHPEVGTSRPKELNFFFGDGPGGPGNWWRGPTWYAAQFPTGLAVNAEASPGYTSPDHPEVARRMAELVPDVRVLYLTRDPLERAVSQFLHHRRDGDEQRDVGAAILDPGSQYLARSRHHERLEPFLHHLPRGQVRTVAHRDLLERRPRTLRAVFDWLGVDRRHWSDTYERKHNTAAQPHPHLPPEVVEQFRAAVADDVERSTGLVGLDLLADR